jgi:hypothetical protein
MTTPVKERLNYDWQKAQEVGSQKLERLREILKTASQEVVSELKGGSSEIETVGRGALANLIISLKQPAAESAAAAPVESDEHTLIVIASQTAEPAAAPTWRQLLSDLVGLVRDRRGDLLQLVRHQFQIYLQKVDTDMNQEYGDRYEQLKAQFRKARDRYGVSRQGTSAAAEPAAAQPVEVEVLED